MRPTSSPCNTGQRMLVVAQTMIRCSLQQALRAISMLRKGTLRVPHRGACWLHLRSCNGQPTIDMLPTLDATKLRPAASLGAKPMSADG